MSLRPILVVSAVWDVCEVKNILLPVQNKERVREMCFFDQEPLPHSAYLGRQKGGGVHVMK